MTDWRHPASAQAWPALLVCSGKGRRCPHCHRHTDTVITADQLPYIIVIFRRQFHSTPHWHDDTLDRWDTLTWHHQHQNLVVKWKPSCNDICRFVAQFCSFLFSLRHLLCAKRHEGNLGMTTYFSLFKCVVDCNPFCKVFEALTADERPNLIMLPWSSCLSFQTPGSTRNINGAYIVVNVLMSFLPYLLLLGTWGDKLLKSVWSPVCSLHALVLMKSTSKLSVEKKVNCWSFFAKKKFCTPCGNLYGEGWSVHYTVATLLKLNGDRIRYSGLWLCSQIEPN